MPQVRSVWAGENQELLYGRVKCFAFKMELEGWDSSLRHFQKTEVSSQIEELKERNRGAEVG